MQATQLVDEAIEALGYVAFDRRVLLMSCRQLLTRQPSIGPLWTACTRLLLAMDPALQARELLRESRHDHILDRAAYEAQLAGAHLLVVHAAGSASASQGSGVQFLVAAEQRSQADQAAAVGMAVWAAVPTGAWLTDLYFSEARRRCIEGGAVADTDSYTAMNASVEVMEASNIRRIVSNEGDSNPEDFNAKGLPAQPVAPELLAEAK